MQTIPTVVPTTGRDIRTSPSPNRAETRFERSPQITKQKGHRSSPQRSAQEQSLATNLQSQLSQLSSKYNDLVKRYNILENSYQSLEDRSTRLQEESRTSKEQDESKDREFKNLSVKITYLTNEKNEFEKKLLENKKYITKIEQKLLQMAKKKPTGSELKDISFSHLNSTNSQNQNPHSSFSFDSKQKSDHKKSAGKDAKNLEETVVNQAYEIKVLTTALETQVQLANVSGGMPLSTTLAKESAALKIQAMDYKKQNETLSQQVVALTNENRSLRERLEETEFQLTSQREENMHNQQVKREAIFNNEDLKKNLNTLEAEKNSLYNYIEELNERLRATAEENRMLIQQMSDVNHRDFMKGPNTNNFGLQSKDQEIKMLRDALEKERVQSNALSDRLQGELIKQHDDQKSRTNTEHFELQKEREVSHLKGLLEEQSNQVAYYREQYQVVVREKDELRSAVEGFIRRSSSLENTGETGKERSPSKSYKMKDLLVELEALDQERKKLKQALNEAINRCAGFKMMEKDHEKELKKKDQQIENIINSRNLMQNTLAEQIYTLKNRNEHLRDELLELQEKAKQFKIENEELRSMLKLGERKALDRRGNSAAHRT